MKYTLIAILILFLSCDQKSEVKESSLPHGPYFSLTADTTAQIFGKDFISKEHQELNSVFSPDGKEFYYTVADPGRNFYVIMVYKMNDEGDWVGPEVASFSGKYADADPYITADNKKLYFISQRPVNDNDTTPKDFDIWRVDRAGDTWGDAVRLDTTINTPNNEYYASVTNDGSIFYSGQYDGGLGYGDIYEARLIDGKYEIKNLGDAINSEFGEGDPFVSPDGKLMIFMSWGRKDDMGRGDLYMSLKKDGEWQKAQNLGPRINSTSFEYCPMLSPDGNYLFWTSYRSSPLENPNKYNYDSYMDRIQGPDNGLGNVYWIKTDVLEEFK